MEEKILVYRDPNYNKWMDFYKRRVKELQELVDGMKSLSIKPTIENLKRLLEGENLNHLSVENDIDKHLSFLPKRLRASLKEAATKECEDEYNEKLGEKVVRFIDKYQRKHCDMVSLSGLCKDVEIMNGVVSITKECLNRIDRVNSVYIDSPGRKSVYDAYQRFIEAYKDFEQAVKDAPKKPNSYYMGQTFGSDHNSMRALGGEYAYAVVRLIDGNLKLDGSCIGDFQ